MRLMLRGVLGFIHFLVPNLQKKKGSKKKAWKTGRREQLIKMGEKKIKSFYKEVKKDNKYVSEVCERGLV